MLCAGVTVYSALRKSGAQGGDWVAILGAGGGLGHLACQIARALGIRVIGIDAGSKKDLAVQCGAEIFIDHTQGNAEEEVKKATGGLGVQAVLVLTAANAAYARQVEGFRVACHALTDSGQWYVAPEIWRNSRLRRPTRRRAEARKFPSTRKIPTPC